MARKPAGRGKSDRFDMRVKPRQRRSEFTVAAIKEAALQLLGEHGVPGATTERIARRAGVGIGTLYEYFPNREAILKALYEDASIGFAHTMQGIMPGILGLPTDQAVTRVMRKLIAMHEQHQLVLIRLVSELPELRTVVKGVSIVNLVQGSVRAYVQGRNPRLKRKDVERKAFVIQRTILGCIQAFLVERPPGITRQELARELARVVSNIIEER